jgi:1-acyl-sn-glycerol-3-phosphate acyltransferase
LRGAKIGVCIDCCKSISVIRGNGVDQIGIDKALNVLNNNGWIHIYPEGRVNQADELLSPLRWGVGKLAAMSATSPLIVPIYFDGFQRIFPEKPLTGKWEVEGMMKMIYSRLPGTYSALCVVVLVFVYLTERIVGAQSVARVAVRGPFQITFGDAVTFDEQREQVKQAREELYSRIGDSKQIDVGQNWQVASTWQH